MTTYNFSKINLIIFCCLFFSYSYCALAQTNEDKIKIVNLLKKSKSFYDNNVQFEMSTSYNLYLGNSNKAVESYKGLCVKNNTNYYSKIGQTEFITIDKATIKIDNESKLMQYFKNEDKSSELVYDLAKYCENFGTFNLKGTATQWICTLTSREVTFVPFSKIIIYLNKMDCSIIKQELFLISQVATKDANKKEIFSYPKLQITFSNINLTKPTKDYFKISNYIELKKGKYYPAKKYIAYQIVD